MALVLDSLMIRGFRSLEQLDVERLGRANLLVGRNGSGKSSVLEALKLYATRGAGWAFYEVLRARDEIAELREGTAERGGFASSESVRQLFSRRAPDTFSQEITIGPLRGSQLQLTIGLNDDFDERLGPSLTVGSRDGSFAVDNLVKSPTERYAQRAICPHQLVSPNGLPGRDIASFWDEVTLTELEEEVLRAMRIIAPTLERISFIAAPNGTRVAMAKLREELRPVPVRSLGDGVTRLLGISLALVSARDGFLLFDEAENGIHFSAQADLWRLIFATAARLNVQVFATTHSWDCIQAFQEAAANDPHEEAALIRLEARDGVTVPTIISEHDLAIVTREQIEVR